MTQQKIGIAIKERRKKLGINQQTLADLASVAVNTVVAIERGEGNPQLATLLTILDTLGLQIDINIKQLDYETVYGLCSRHGGWHIARDGCQEICVHLW